MAADQHLGPSQAGDRFEVLDALRGAALFGIMVANSVLCALFLYLSWEVKATSSAAATDRVLEMLQLVFIEGIVRHLLRPVRHALLHPALIAAAYLALPIALWKLVPVGGPQTIQNAL